MLGDEQISRESQKPVATPKIYFEIQCSSFQKLTEVRAQAGVAGVMVSIVAFQAVDPGSIPGRRTGFFMNFLLQN